ncbi:MAG: hypothetical protein HC938_13175 [Nitrospira sp.]|nr:hypothetical protein [Nitrospira sp.]
MNSSSHVWPVRGLCTVSQLLDTLMLFMPVGTALVCIEAAIGAGLYVQGGDVFPGRTHGSELEVQQHFMPLVPSMTSEQREIVHRECYPFGLLQSREAIDLLIINSDVIAQQAVERGWITRGSRRRTCGARSSR